MFGWVKAISVKLLPFKVGLRAQLHIPDRYEYFIGEKINLSGFLDHKFIEKQNLIKNVDIVLGDQIYHTHNTTDNVTGTDNKIDRNIFFQKNIVLSSSGGKKIWLEIKLKNGKRIKLQNNRFGTNKIFVKDYNVIIDIPSNISLNLYENIRLHGFLLTSGAGLRKLKVYDDSQRFECRLGSILTVEDALFEDLPDSPNITIQKFFMDFVFNTSGTKNLTFQGDLEDDRMVHFNFDFRLMVQGLRYDLVSPKNTTFMKGKNVVFEGWCTHDRKKISRVVLRTDDFEFECKSGRGFHVASGDRFGFICTIYFYNSGKRNLYLDVYMEDGKKEIVDLRTIYIKKGPISPILRKDAFYKLKNKEHFKVNPVDQNRNHKKLQSIVFTIVSKKYLNHALTLKNSFIEKNPDHSFFIFLGDYIYKKAEYQIFEKLFEENGDIFFWPVLRNEMGIGWLEPLFFKYNENEMPIILKPYIFDYIFRKGFQKAIYVCPFSRCKDNTAFIEYELSKMAVVAPGGFADQERNEFKNYKLIYLGLNSNAFSTRTLQRWKKTVFDKGFNGNLSRIYNDLRRMEMFPLGLEISGDDEDMNRFKFDPNMPNTPKNIVQVHENQSPFINYCYPPWEPISKISNENNFVIDEFKETENYQGLKNYFDYISGTDIRIPEVLRKCFYPYVFENEMYPFRPDEINVQNFINSSTEILYEDTKINKTMVLIWESRNDLRETFKDLDNKSDRTRFKEWLQKYAKDEYLLDDRFLSENSKNHKLLPTKNNAGINIYSYFRQILGISEAAKSFVRSICYGGIPISLYNIESDIHETVSTVEYENYYFYLSEKPIFDTNFFFVNAPELQKIVKIRHPYLFKNKYNIGCFWWELEGYFENQKNVFDDIDAVLVFSSFVKKAIEKAGSKNVDIHQLKYPFYVNWEITHPKDIVRKRMGYDAKDVIYFFNFDYLSTIERKNPEGIIKSFSQAFKGSLNHAKLIIKTLHSAERKKESKRLNEIIRDSGMQESILVVDHKMNKNDLMTLLNAVDCYLSLHRSEGLGLGMMEAMSLGIPVIATRYGGNLDFMDDNNALLVDSKMTTIEKDCSPYKKGWVWAEPDLETATEYIKRIYHDRTFAKRLGKKGKTFIDHNFNPLSFIKDFYRYLKDIKTI